MECSAFVEVWAPERKKKQNSRVYYTVWILIETSFAVAINIGDGVYF